MRTFFRSFIAAGAIAAALVATASPAAAAPKEKPVQGVTLYSNTVSTFGDHDFCRGSANARYTSPKRGILRLTLTSNGFTGNGAGWKRNPSCRILLIASQVSSVSFLGETFIPVSFSAKPGQKITRDIRTGSGLVSFGLAPYAAKSPVRVLQGSGFTSYLLVP